MHSKARDILTILCGKQPKEAQTRHEELVSEYHEELKKSLDAMQEEKKKQIPPIEFTYSINTEAKWDFPVLQFSAELLEEK
jgi:hypothetical protein